MERDRLFMTIMCAIAIFLSVILLFAVVDHGPVSGERWSFSASDTLREGNMFVGDDGTFYTAAGHTIYAIAADGGTRWSLDPGFASWYGNNYKSLRIQAAAFGDGYTYMLVIPSDQNDTTAADGKLLVVSADGKVAWSRNVAFPKKGSLTAAEDMLIVFNNYNMTAFDGRNGTLLWSIGNVESPVVDPAGEIYCIKDLGENRMINGPMAVTAYDLNGTQRWSRLLSELGTERLAYGSSLMFLNHTVYVPYYNGNMAGIIALGDGGNFMWRQDISEFNGVYAADPDGSIYFCIRYGDVPPNAWVSPNVVILGPDGNKTVVAGPRLGDSLGQLIAIANGTAYYFQVEPHTGNMTLQDIDNYLLSGYDLKADKVLWQARVRFEPETVAVDSSNVGSILFSAGTGMAPLAWNADNIGNLFAFDWYNTNFDDSQSIQSVLFDPSDMTPRTVNRSYIRVTADSGIVLVDTWAYNFAYPDIYNKSICACAGGIYALNVSDGQTLWSSQTDSYVTSMTEKNGTIFYRTGDGRFSSGTVGLAAGFAAAAFYLFFRFFMLGAVSRARSRLDKNANRNAILDFIAANPGATLYEIAKELKINLGTVRYHLLVLSVNYKVISDKHGPKSVGYFVNGRRYSADERLIMSLVRREQIRKLLAILSGRPGLANTDIAAEMRLPESSVSRYLSELYEKGIVIKRKSDVGKMNYFIVEKYAPVVAGVCSTGYVADRGTYDYARIPVAAGTK